MSESRFFCCTNNGTTAILLEKDFRLLQEDWVTAEEALAKGVRWYVFMRFNRLLHAETDFAEAPLATSVDYQFLMKEAGWKERTTEANFFVPFSNGPRYYREERKFIFPLAQLLFRAVRVTP